MQMVRCWWTLLVSVSLAILFGGCQPARSVTVRGQIVDDATGRPVPNANVCFQTAFGNVSVVSDYRMTTTDANGHFEFLRVRVKEALTSYVRLCAMKKGYDWTTVWLGSTTGYEDPVEIRLEPDRRVRLPQGRLRIKPKRLMDEDEPTIGFVFREQQLRLAGDNQPTDFQLHFKFLPENDRKDKMLGSIHPSKSGRLQFLASVTATGGIARLACDYVTGHPPRLPNLAEIALADSFSFDRPYDSWFRKKNEFLLKTNQGKYALLHFDGVDRIEWVYQPDGSRDIDRRRKKSAGLGHCWKCDFVSE